MGKITARLFPTGNEEPQVPPRDFKPKTRHTLQDKGIGGKRLGHKGGGRKKGD